MGAKSNGSREPVCPPKKVFIVINFILIYYTTGSSAAPGTLSPARVFELQRGPQRPLRRLLGVLRVPGTRDGRGAGGPTRSAAGALNASTACRRYGGGLAVGGGSAGDAVAPHQHHG